MLFSLDWLLELCPVERDVERIAAALTARGLTVDSVEPRGADHVLDVDVPANRPDCLGHLGLARELGAARGSPLAGPPEAAEGQGSPADDEARVEIRAPSLCPRYTAGLVRGVRVEPSPDWVVRRLEACGLRPVNNVVDASNLVMLELGQPVHFFDLDQLQTDADGRRTIRVRTARPGETLETLDGVERRLDDEMLLIAEGSRGVALAGVIGGAETEIGPETRNVLVEAAHFDRRSVRRTARRLGLDTDASYRFERGVDPAAPPAAQRLAARLLEQLAGGRRAPGIIDAHPAPPTAPALCLRESELRRLLGFAPDPRQVAAALEAVELAPRPVDGGWGVAVPSWRVDLQCEADLVEEVARHIGYDDIPTAASIVIAEPAPDAPGLEGEDRVRDCLAHHGFCEAVGYAMIAAGEDEPFAPDGWPEPIALTNPIAETLAFLRRSTLPGLMRAVDLNLRRGSRDVRLFEVGRVFRAPAAGAGPEEPRRLGLAWCGAARRPHWSDPDRDVDLYDLTGVAEHLLRSMRPTGDWRRVPGAPRAFHPGLSVSWAGPDGVLVAHGGALHPELQRARDQRVFLLEVDLDAVETVTEPPTRQRAVPRVPSVIRDLSLVLGGDRTYGSLLDCLRAVDSPAPVRFEAIDRYEGPPLGPGETSLTVRLTLEPLERTLTDEETDGYRTALVERLRDALGVTIRS